MKKVAKLRFNTSEPQVWHDPWRQTDRVCRYVGLCIQCGVRCYAFDDGQNDPRGALGDHANYGVGTEDGLGREHPACFPCMNTEHTYRRAKELARIAERGLFEDK